MNLVANAVMLQNVVDLTSGLNTAIAEGYPVTRELVGRLSPYMREHIRRFGQYVLDMEEVPEPLEPKAMKLELSPTYIRVLVITLYTYPAHTSRTCDQATQQTAVLCRLW